ncbi:DUF4142 domain-containing protein [Pseudonocardia sp. N23]|uniref:DUF4142 domain-containing protein n=1 Tax=Pseudonocardia sp. N23 TaxID=1987376 RepID=UPI000C037A38|nr:DUF4142 domain-containing protein [Pseudonocardia sp. N23]GAY07067.1 hypothetical protein TOK_1580 [Pseudonocardia sp. N23]
MSYRRGRIAAATLIGSFALLGASACSAGTDADAPAPGATPLPTASASAQPGAGGQATEAQRAAFGQAHQGALALIALGGLGTNQGDGDQVKGLAPDVTSNGQALDQAIRDQATAQGVALTDGLSSAQQQVINDLQARNGQPFDQAWLRAALDMEQQARDAANAILNDPNASPEAKKAAQDALAGLDALKTRLTSASTSSGAADPGSVNAGTGGQAAEGDDVLPIALIGGGAALLAGAGLYRRRSRA